MNGSSSDVANREKMELWKPFITVWTFKSHQNHLQQQQQMTSNNSIMMMFQQKSHHGKQKKWCALWILEEDPSIRSCFWSLCYLSLRNLNWWWKREGERGQFGILHPPLENVEFEWEGFELCPATFHPVSIAHINRRKQRTKRERTKSQSNGPAETLTFSPHRMHKLSISWIGFAAAVWSAALRASAADRTSLITASSSCRLSSPPLVTVAIAVTFSAADDPFFKSLFWVASSFFWWSFFWVVSSADKPSSKVSGVTGLGFRV